jgi:uncharacterized protein (TIGR04255 family)
MTRPEHLPDFTNPPLDEVVLGIQFSPVTSYSSVHARDIWELFKDEYPIVQEQPLLNPQFETFGGGNIQPNIQFQIGISPVGSRLWFISDDDSHLLQFQRDRFLTNWRKRPKTNPYPRYEVIAERFEKSLGALERNFAENFSCSMDRYQAELIYISIIPVESFADAARWFSLWNDGILNIEGMNASFSEVIKDESARPHARLFHEIQSVFSVDGKHKAFKLTLTFRGKPAGNDVGSAMEFLWKGREAIVLRFAQITTDQAHQMWGIQ